MRPGALSVLYGRLYTTQTAAAVAAVGLQQPAGQQQQQGPSDSSGLGDGEVATEVGIPWDSTMND
jgi:hypothetical protein